MTYLFKNLNTCAPFTVEAPTLQEAFSQAFKICPFSQLIAKPLDNIIEEDTTMKNFYFIDNETGEDFIVQATDYHTAVGVASEYFDEPCFAREMSDYEAEMIGADVY